MIVRPPESGIGDLTMHESQAWAGALPDDLKLRSCMTLFVRAAPDEALFQQVLGQYFGGAPDPWTVELLAASGDLSH